MDVNRHTGVEVEEPEELVLPSRKGLDGYPSKLRRIYCRRRMIHTIDEPNSLNAGLGVPARLKRAGNGFILQYWTA